MIRLFDEDRLFELRKEYQKSKLYCSLYPGLAELERLYGELSPTQIWHEMEVFCARRLLGTQELEMEVIALCNSLLKRYSAFETSEGEQIERSPRQAEYTTVCVLTCVCFRLVSEPDEIGTWNSTEAVKEILKMISTHPVHVHLFKAQRKREEWLESVGNLIKREPWVNGGQEEVAQRTIKVAAGGSEKSQQELFNGLFKTISLDDWTDFLRTCEKGISFKHNIDRLAYMVLANHKRWLRSPKAVNVSNWVSLMNSLLGTGKKMQATEVSRKLNEMKNEPFYESLLDLNNCFEFTKKNLSQQYFERLKENVKKMHAFAKKQ